MSIIKKIQSYFSLVHIENRFTDSVSGKTVALYRDKFGQEFHKDSRWSFFAIPVFRATYTHVDGNPLPKSAVDRGAKAIADEIDRQVMEAVRRHNAQ